MPKLQIREQGKTELTLPAARKAPRPAWGRRHSRLSAFTQQRAEARLDEMAIGGERLLQAALLHDEEGNAIDQRPRLVGTFGEQIQALSKQRQRTWHVDRGCIAEKFIDK